MTQFCSFDGWVVLHCICVQHLLCPFICWWTYSLLPSPGYCTIVLQWTLGCICLFELWFSKGIGPVVGLLVHMAIIFRYFKEASILFSTVVVSIYISTSSESGFPSSTLSPAFIAYGFSHDGHIDGVRWYLILWFAFL